MGCDPVITKGAFDSERRGLLGNGPRWSTGSITATSVKGRDIRPGPTAGFLALVLAACDLEVLAQPGEPALHQPGDPLLSRASHSPWFPTCRPCGWELSSAEALPRREYPQLRGTKVAARGGCGDGRHVHEQPRWAAFQHLAGVVPAARFAHHGTPGVLRGRLSELGTGGDGVNDRRCAARDLCLCNRKHHAGRARLPCAATRCGWTASCHSRPHLPAGKCLPARSCFKGASAAQLLDLGGGKRAGGNPGRSGQGASWLCTETLAGFPSRGGGVEELDLGKVAGQTVRLRFELRDADVYSMRFGEKQ